VPSDGPTCVFKEIDESGYNRLVLRGISDNPAFSDMTFSHLKLGLDKGNDKTFIFKEFGNRRDNECQ
jgi:hypothetical protein